MKVIEILSALLTPVIAVVTTYIAIQQFRTNQAKFKLEMFEKRYAIYSEIKTYIQLSVREGTVTHGAILELNEQTHDVFFLFDESVDRYIAELRSNGARLIYLNSCLSDQALGIGEERSRLAEESAQIHTWFGAQLEQAKQVFKRFLRI